MNENLQLRFHIRYLLLVIASLFLCACNQSGVKKEGPNTKQVNFDSLAKTDLSVVMEIHVDEVRTSLRTLMIKLYKRNPGLNSIIGLEARCN